MNKIQLKLVLMLTTVSLTVFSQEDEFAKSNIEKSSQFQWVRAIGIKHTHFIGVAPNRILAIYMDEEFQPCPDFMDSSGNAKGPTYWANVREENVGKEMFETISSVSMSSVLADKRVSLYQSRAECEGTRSMVIGIRLDK